MTQTTEPTEPQAEGDCGLFLVLLLFAPLWLWLYLILHDWLFPITGSVENFFYFVMLTVGSFVCSLIALVMLLMCRFSHARASRK